MKSLIFFLLILSEYPTQAQVFAPSAVEIKIRFEASFVSSQAFHEEELAESHFNHLFGLMKSRRLVESLGVNFEKVEGVGAPLMPPQIEILHVKNLSRGQVEIKYRGSSRALVLKQFAKEYFSKGTWLVPMPYDLDRYYKRKCTDPHYFSLGDFWYFFDPFLDGCEELTQEPLARMVEVKVSPATRRELDMQARLDLLRGPNGNGELFQIDLIHGFSESAERESDEGRRNFKELNRYLRRTGFSERVLDTDPRHLLSAFSKSLTSLNGRQVQVLVRHLLVDTELDTKSTTFARFFKQAVEEADVVIYAGHSGLGANLDIPSLEQKVGGYEFNSKKRQIFYFDSCSSYSYYLAPFRDQKTRPRLDILTNALASYFNTGVPVLTAFLEVLLDLDSIDQTWDQIIQKMEAPLEGESYLLNVGGI